MKKLVYVCSLLTIVSCSTPESFTKVSNTPAAEYSTSVGQAKLATDNSLTDIDGKIDGVFEDIAVGWIRNRRNDSIDVCMVARKYESPGGSDQSVFSLDCQTLAPGQTSRFGVKLAPCKTEIELIRGDERVARKWSSLNYIDVAYAGSIAGCGFDTCPAIAPYLWPDGACHSGSYHPPHTPTPEPEPEPDDDDSGPSCPDGTILNIETGQCDPVIEPVPDPEPEPEHGMCLYEVAGRNKQSYCESKGGLFSSHDGSDHCIFGFPGISDQKLNLAPGLSDPDCLRKQDN